MEYAYKNLQTATAIHSEHIQIIREKLESIIAEKSQGSIDIKNLGLEKTKLKYIVVRSIEISLNNQINQQEYVILELVD